MSRMSTVSWQPSHHTHAASTSTHTHTAHTPYAHPWPDTHGRHHHRLAGNHMARHPASFSATLASTPSLLPSSLLPLAGPRPLTLGLWPGAFVVYDCSCCFAPTAATMHPTRHLNLRPARSPTTYSYFATLSWCRQARPSTVGLYREPVTTQYHRYNHLGTHTTAYSHWTHAAASIRRWWHSYTLASQPRCLVRFSHTPISPHRPRRTAPPLHIRVCFLQPLAW